jgi:hypothetical protein
MKACRRPSFAEDAAYSFKRGRRQDEKTGDWVDNYVSGPSVNLAREAKRVWGNIQSGVEIVRDDEESRKIRAWAWDIETNVKVFAEDGFLKLIQRKVGKGASAKTEWVKPDERDLRELTNRRGAIIERNCILATLPKDLIEDALTMAEQTIVNKVEEDPDGARKKIILAFSELNVSPEMLAAKLGHPIVQCSPKQIAELRKIYKSIVDGNSTWAEYAGAAPAAGSKPEDVQRPRRASEPPIDVVPAQNTNTMPSEEAPVITDPVPLTGSSHSDEQLRTEAPPVDGAASGNAGPVATSGPPPPSLAEIEICQGGDVINSRCTECLDAATRLPRTSTGAEKTCPKGHGAFTGLFCPECMK